MDRRATVMNVNMAVQSVCATINHNRFVHGASVEIAAARHYTAPEKHLKNLCDSAATNVGCVDVRKSSSCMLDIRTESSFRDERVPQTRRAFSTGNISEGK